MARIEAGSVRKAIRRIWPWQRGPGLEVLLYEPIEHGALGAAAVQVAGLRYAGRADIRVRP